MKPDNQSTRRNARARRKPTLTLRLIRAGLRGVGWVSPRLAARVALRLWFQPRRFPEPPREARWRNTAKTTWLQHSGVELATYIWGSGPVVLLVHGWDARGPQLGSLVRPLTDAGYQVVALDLPGHGRSGGKTTNILESAEAIRAVAAAHGPLVAVVGHSFGAIAAVRALRDGLAADKAVCISPPAQLRWMTDRFCRVLRLTQRVQQQLEARMVREFGPDIWQQVSTDHNALGLDMPALIIHDRDDGDVPLSQGEAVASAWPESELLITTGLGHRRILRNRRVAQAIVRFVQSVPAGTQDEQEVELHAS